MKQNIRFLRKAAVLVLTTVFVLTSCTPGPIVIGFQGPLTGTAADLGVQGRNGALLAVETINAAGGVRGRPLHLDPRDDYNERAIAAELVEQFRQEQVEVVIGPMTSVAGVAVAEQIVQQGPLYISPTVSTAEVSGRDDFFFRIQGASDRPATVLGQFSVRELEAERVVVLADQDNAEYSVPYLDAFSRGVTSEGGEVVQVHTVPLVEMKGWSQMIETMAHAEPDTVLVVASASDTARFAHAVRSEGKTWQLLGSGWAATETLPTLGAAAVEGIMLSRMSYPVLTATAAGAEFQKRFLRRFGRAPSFAANQAYDAVQLVADVLKNARPTAADLRQEILGVESYDTFLGPVVFNEFGDIEPSATIIRVTRGGYVTVADYGEGAPQ